MQLCAPFSIKRASIFGMNIISDRACKHTHVLLVSFDRKLTLNCFPENWNRNVEMLPINWKR